VKCTPQLSWQLLGCLRIGGTKRAESFLAIYKGPSYVMDQALVYMMDSLALAFCLILFKAPSILFSKKLRAKYTSADLLQICR